MNRLAKPLPSRFVNRPRHPIRRTRRRLHAPVQIVTVSAREIHASHRLNGRGPEFTELPGSIVTGLASHGPLIPRPIDGHDVIDVRGFSWIMTLENAQSRARRRTRLTGPDQYSTISLDILSHRP